MPQDRHAPIPRQPRELEKKEERRGDTGIAEEAWRFRREVGEHKGTLDRYKAEVQRLKAEEAKLVGKCKRREERIAQLEHDYAKLRGSLQEVTEAQARKVRAMQERLKLTEELLEARTAELSGAQTFLSTADRLSEMEVLSIVRDLNENIYQVAVSLTEAWENLESSQTAGRIEVDPTSQPHTPVPVLVQLARKRDLTGLTFLIQTVLCYQAVEMTGSWVYNQELGVLNDVYRRLTTSGEHRINTKQYVTYVS